MNDLPQNATDNLDGSASTPLSVVSLVGDLTRITQAVQREGYGNCSDCQKGWMQLNNGLEELATLLLAMVMNHAMHCATTTDAAGTSLHPTFQRIVESW